MSLGNQRLGILCQICEKEKAIYLKGEHLLPNKVLIVLQQNMCELCWKEMVTKE